MDYIGTELELFSHAKNWKSYFSKKVSTYIHGEVLEVGAGIGSNTKYLINENVYKWTLLEPDIKLLDKAKNIIKDDRCNFISNLTCELLPGEKNKYDTIIYIDVIEHIEEDKLEIENAYELLKSGGHLIILVPAHQFLFSPFDKSVGHFRRYSKSGLDKVIYQRFERVCHQYLDSVGLFVSLANRLILSQSTPTLRQIKIWDNTLVPLSTIADRMTFGCFGKSVISIQKK